VKPLALEELSWLFRGTPFNKLFIGGIGLHGLMGA
jgi:hypothetical protein